MAKKRQNTGKDIATVKDIACVVIVSITDDNMVMIRSEMHGTIMMSVIMSIDAANQLGIKAQNVTTFGELEKTGKII